MGEGTEALVSTQAASLPLDVVSVCLNYQKKQKQQISDLSPFASRSRSREHQLELHEPS